MNDVVTKYAVVETISSRAIAFANQGGREALKDAHPRVFNNNLAIVS